MDQLHLKIPVISGFIGICAFAETYRNRLAFDDTIFKTGRLRWVNVISLKDRAEVLDKLFVRRR